MSISKLAKALLPAILAGMASSHMIMNTPTPYGKPQVSPLDGSAVPFPCQLQGDAQINEITSVKAGSSTPVKFTGSAVPFPCQLQGDAQINEITSVKAGSSTPVKFTGSAVHGGGSCQFSINYGDPASQNPKDWHVIYTIIGGCPASAVGNLVSTGTDPDGRAEGPQCKNMSDKECDRQFNVPIPKGLKNGNATFAWTWFNKIGNREMYMNCAPISISDGGDDDSFINGLPSIFMANIDGKPCQTAGSSGAVLNIPDPGKYGLILEAPDPSATGTCSSGGSVPDPHFESGGDSGGGGGNDGGSQSSLSIPAAPPSTFVTSIRTSPTNALPASSPAGAGPGTSTAAGPENTSDSSAPPPANTGGPVDCGSVSSGFFCIDETHFGLCDRGSAIPQSVAEGTKCDISKHQIVAAN